MPELPSCLAYLFEWYNECRTGDVLRFADIQAWKAATCTPCSAWEARSLIDLDRIYWTETRKQ